MITAMRIVQCWDDGVTVDVRLVSLLRRHGACATFNLNAGLHACKRQFGWRHSDTEVWRLGCDDLRGVYDGLGVANDSLTYPHVDKLPIEEARREIHDGRARPSGVFWFWGHSYELVDKVLWTALENSLAQLCAEPGVQWCNPTDLFDGEGL
jgi:hypothetical protein